MKLFLWNELNKVSDRWHPEGGLVVVANDLEHCKELIQAANEKEAAKWRSREPDDYISLSDEEWERVAIYDLAAKYEPAVYVFPDAGCC